MRPTIVIILMLANQNSHSAYVRAPPMLMAVITTSDTAIHTPFETSVIQKLINSAAADSSAAGQSRQR
jgi:hypothetical protein